MTPPDDRRVITATEARQPEDDDLLSDIVYDPAWGEISRLLLAAKSLGFNPRDPDIIRRAVNAGREAYANRLVRHDSSLGPINAHAPVVYYMQLGSLIKIGTSTNLRERVATLNPERVLAVEPGDREKEAQRHRQFWELHQHGEWFTMNRDILEHVQALRQKFEADSGLTVDAWLDRPSPRKRPLTSSVSTLDSSLPGPEPETSNRYAGSASDDHS